MYSVQVQTEEKRQRNVGGSAIKSNQYDRQKKPAQDEQFESTTKLVVTSSFSFDKAQFIN